MRGGYKRFLSIVNLLLCFVSSEILNAQNVGIGEPAPNSKLHITVPTTYTSPVFRIEVGTSTKFIVRPAGLVGINTPSPTVPLQIHGGTDVTPSSGGYLQIGTNSSNITIDDNEIMARNKVAGTPLNLHLNMDGGDVYIHYNLAGRQIAFLDNGNTGIGTPTPVRTLHVKGTMRLTQLVPGITPQSVLFVDNNGDVGGLPLSAFEDHDWYKATTTSPPQSINDTIYTLGNVGIGTNAPEFAFHLVSDGSNNDGVIVAQGVYGTAKPMPTNPITAFIWHPGKSAIRAGAVTGTQWSTANTGDYSVAFGLDNQSSSAFSVITGGNMNTASDTGTFIGGGYSNSATADYSIVVGGFSNSASGQESFVGGGLNNQVSGFADVIVGGENNSVNGGHGFIGGGYKNNVLASTAVVVGGDSNAVSGYAAFVGAGMRNFSSGDVSFLGSGSANSIILSSSSAIVAGDSNRINQGYRSFIGGGLANMIDTSYGSVIVGGSHHYVGAPHSFIGSGHYDTVKAAGSAIVGGVFNVINTNSPIDGIYSFIGAGRGNRIINSTASVITGGLYNYINSNNDANFVGGGIYDTVNARYSALVGGAQNSIRGGSYNFIGGGRGNKIIAPVAGSAILGGTENIVQAGGSVILGGDNNRATGLYNLVFGTQVIPTVSEANRVYFFAPNFPGFLVLNRLDGDFPIHVGTTTTNGNGAHLTAGGVWTNGSSITFKERFDTLNPQIVLNKIRGLTVSAWYYKGTNERHIGPIAEEFHSLFKVGILDHPENNKYLSSLDVAGVSLIGVKALDSNMQELQKKLTQLENENNQLRKEIQQLKQEIEYLKRSVSVAK